MMRRRPILIALVAVGLAVIGWGAFAPVERAPREALYEIPAGTSARRLAGETDLEILPQSIRLGVRDTLALRNGDEVPHVFGPALIMPGQTFRLPFAQASTYSFLCTAHAEGSLEVVVEPLPAPGWQRLRWRWREWTGRA